MVTRIWVDLELGKVKPSLPDAGDIREFYKALVRKKMVETYPGRGCSVEDAVTWAAESAVDVANTHKRVLDELGTLQRLLEEKESVINTNREVDISSYLDAKNEAAELRAKIREFESACSDLSLTAGKLKEAFQEFLGRETPTIRCKDLKIKLSSGNLIIEKNGQSVVL